MKLIFYNIIAMSKYNTFTNHPLIPNSQEYMVIRKYVSIHSEDRDILKYPNSAEFEIELPQDYVNVLSIRLESWSFPSNYSTFSQLNKNITMSFQITYTTPPTTPIPPNDLDTVIYSAINTNIQNSYSITIEQGYYTPQQMVTELTNKFNEVVTNYIYTYIIANIPDPTLQTQYINQLTAIGGGYADFVIVYNEVTQKIWFGNKNATFVLLNVDNNSQYILDSNDKIIPNPSFTTTQCPPSKTQLPDYTNWGLPSYLGLPRTPVTSTPTSTYPRFYYGDVVAGDKGYWLINNLSAPDCSLNYIEADCKINIIGPAYFYMDLAQLNNIDETNPYNLSNFTLHTNETNSRVNSSFAKITVPYSGEQCFENNRAYKIYNPPAERMRKIKLRMRYHNGQIVNFGCSEYSFTLEFTLYNAQQSKKYNNYIPENNIFT
jgi:hypothetical protein